MRRVRRPAGHDRPPQARSVLLDGRAAWSGLEILLHGRDGVAREVHVYEGYWAPLTEGAVKLRDVVAFLFAEAERNLERRAEERVPPLALLGIPVLSRCPDRALLALLAALGVVLGLVALNASVALAAMVRTPLKEPPKWLGDALFADLSTASDLVLGAVFSSPRHSADLERPSAP